MHTELKSVLCIAKDIGDDYKFCAFDLSLVANHDQMTRV